MAAASLMAASRPTAPGEDAAVPLILSVDVGGTHMRAAVLDGATVVDHHVVDTPGGEPRPTALMALLREMGTRHDVDHAVVGLPGRVDYRAGSLEYAPNLPPSWVAELNADLLSSVLGRPALLANDADLAAVGEAYLGAGRAYADLAYVTISTGVGAGVLLNRRLVSGSRSLAEIGHVVIDRVAARTDLPATVELLGSGTALARDAAALGVMAHDQALMRLIESGDEQLRAAWRDVREAAGLAAVALAQLFGPQAIVLGGGLGRAGPDLVQAMLYLLSSFGPRGLPEPIAVVPAELGDDAGLLGAAHWWHAGATSPTVPYAGTPAGRPPGAQ